MSFIDDNCILFGADEENSMLQSDVHTKFKHLVEGLLEDHLNQVGVSEENFFKACEKAVAGGSKVTDAAKYAHQIIDQMIACDDYLTFKKMMFKRNKELEYEAISAITTASLGCASAGKKKGKRFSKTSIPKTKKEADEELEKAIRESRNAAEAQRAYKDDLESKAADRKRILANEMMEKTEEDELARAVAESQLTEAERTYARLAQLEAEEAELAKAIAMSLAVEEERRSMLQEKAANFAAQQGAAMIAEAEAKTVESLRRERDEAKSQRDQALAEAADQKSQRDQALAEAAAQKSQRDQALAEAAARTAEAKVSAKEAAQIRAEAKRAPPKEKIVYRESKPAKTVGKLRESGKAFQKRAVLDPIPAGRNSFAEQRRAVEEYLSNADSGLDSPGLPHMPAPRKASASPGINEAALEERKRHLRAQRERILMAKREKREQQLKEFHASSPPAKVLESKLPSIGRASSSAAPSSSSRDAASPSAQTEGRGHLAYALARRMKHELILEDENSQDALERAGGFNEGFAVYTDLDSKLRAVQELRRERMALLEEHNSRENSGEEEE